MPMTDVMFSKASDMWATPRAFFEALDAEFHFKVDAAASPENTQCKRWYAAAMWDDKALGGDGALTGDWFEDDGPGPYYLNPPYSRCAAFIAKASEEAKKGCTVVCLVPARVDTRWWFQYVWSEEQQRPLPGVEVRFIKGRLKFGDSKNSAPFPSVIIIFRPLEAAR